MPEKKEPLTKYLTQIEHAISPQPHTPMYLMHKYWARKPHNVVAEYIEHYSKRGEIVLDPFVGSGVTAIEAVKSGRKAVAIDLNPFSIFLTHLTITTVKIDDLKEKFQQIEQAVKSQIESLYQTECPICKKQATITHAIWSDVVECNQCHKQTMAVNQKYEPLDTCQCGNKLDVNNIVREELVEIGYECKACIKKSNRSVRFLVKKPDSADTALIAKIQEMEIPFWVPEGTLKYLNGSDFQEGTHRKDIVRIVDIFTKRNLIALSILYNQIEGFPQSDSKDLLKLAFSGNLHNVSKLNVVHHLRLRNGVHPSRGWVMHRYWIPPVRIELPVWFYFEERFKHILRGKIESNAEIPFAKEATDFDSLLNKKSNALLKVHSALELSDILPPESVDYAFTDPPYGGSIQYLELSSLWISWLKGKDNDKRFDLNFENEITINDPQKKDFDYYHKMLKASFEQIYRVLKSGKWLTITFHNTDVKIYNSIVKAGVLSGFDLEKVIYQSPAVVSPKALLQPYGSAVGDYYIRFRKPEIKANILSPSEIDKERYERIVVDTVKHIIAVRREPVTYSIIINSYPIIFNDLKKNGYPFSAPEGLDEVLKRHLGKEFVLVDSLNEKGKVVGKKWWLKEKLFLETSSLHERIEATIIGVLNRKVIASFDDILEEIFTKFQNSLTPDTQSVKSILEEYAEKTPDGKWQLKKQMRVRQSQHNQIIEMLVDLGLKSGFEVYADIPEWRKDFNLPVSKDTMDRIKRIDALWLKDGEIAYEFEVENSTGVSDAIIRGSNIPSDTVKRLILIPEERKNLLIMKISEPIVKESLNQYKWQFIFYDAFLAFYDKAKHRKTIDGAEIEKLVNISTLPKHEQQTLGQFPKEEKS
ncbi:MAG: DNA methyltransferase [Candidatus Bathyarchaeia archaeon]